MLFRYVPFMIRLLLNSPHWLIRMVYPDLLTLFLIKAVSAFNDGDAVRLARIAPDRDLKFGEPMYVKPCELQTSMRGPLMGRHYIERDVHRHVNMVAASRPCGVPRWRCLRIGALVRTQKRCA